MSKTQFPLIFTTSLLTIVVLYYSYIIPIYAKSPSFSIQNILDDLGDWVISANQTDYSIYTSIGNKFDCAFSRIPSDLGSVNYISDGKYINATLWLDKPIEKSNDVISRDYYIQIDVISFNDLGGGDYATGLMWNNNTSSWTKYLVEYSPDLAFPQYRYIKIIPNYTSLNGKSFVNLTLDLDDIKSPDEYRVTFAAEDAFMNNNKFCKMVDPTIWYDAPPPDYNISASKTSVFLKKGQEENILLKVKTDAVFDSLVNLTADNIPGVNVTFTPSNITLPAGSAKTSLIIIKALSNATIGPNELAITSFIKPLELSPVNDPADYSNLTIRKNIPNVTTSVSVTVEEPIGLLEYVNYTLTAWGKPIKEFIALVTAIGGAAVSGWIFLNKFKNKDKKDQ